MIESIEVQLKIFKWREILDTGKTTFYLLEINLTRVSNFGRLIHEVWIHRHTYLNQEKSAFSRKLALSQESCLHLAIIKL